MSLSCLQLVFNPSGPVSSDWQVGNLLLSEVYEFPHQNQLFATQEPTGHTLDVSNPHIAQPCHCGP